MKRLFWIALGAGAGVYAVREASRAAQKLSPTSLLGSLAAQVSEFVDEVRAGMHERESQLRHDLGLDDPEPTPVASYDEHPFESRLSSGGI